MTTGVSIGHAAENEQQDSAPDIEFLEFLGQFETDTGEWVEPGSLLGDGFNELLDVPENPEADGDATNTDDATPDTL